MQTIEGKYQDLCKKLTSYPLKHNEHHFILDGLCKQKGLPLDDSRWHGTFPEFYNKQYRINLQKGTIKKLRSHVMISTLPSDMVSDPLFQNIFGDLKLNELEGNLKINNGIKTLFFKDPQGLQCRIEEDRGAYRYYKIFPHVNNKELQAVSFSNLQRTESNKKDTISDKQPPIPSLPYIFDQVFCVDPQLPTRGFCLTDQGELLFKVEFQETAKKVIIKGIIDCRNQEESGPWEVMCAKDLQHPALSKLSCIEDLSQSLFGVEMGA